MKKQFLLFFIVFCIISITNYTFCQNTIPKWLHGKWTGIGFQPEAANHTAWKIIVEAEQDQITINYPTFPCDGSWKIIKSDNNKAEFIETITTGKNVCMTGGTIIITKINEKYITYTYFLPKYVKGVVAFSTLEKKEESVLD